MATNDTLDALRARIAQIEAGPVSSPTPKPAKGAQKAEKPKDAQAAYQRILRIAGTREQSTERVREKLLRAEFPASVADEAIEKALRVGVLDNRRYCDALVRSTLHAQKGLAKVLREIEGLGIDPLELDSYREYLEEGEEAQLQRACEFLAAHPARSKNPRESAFRKLVSRGYSVPIASQAARRVYPGY